MATVEMSTALVFDDVLLMPQRTKARSRQDVDTSTLLTRNWRLKLPIVSANTPWCTEAAMAIALARLGGIGIIHRMGSIDDQVAEVALVKADPSTTGSSDVATMDRYSRLAVGAAIGAKEADLERAHRLIEAGADVLVIDIAHGHADYVLETIRALKTHHPDVDVIAGNVATREGTRDLIAAGADAVKVGIGPGGICTTRLVAGAGVPQLTAILECAAEAAGSGVPLIADGGVRSSGDIVKALAAGASTVMLGSLLAGTDESASQAIVKDGVRYKTTTGFVSLGVALNRRRLAGEVLSRTDIRHYVPEGVEATFVHTGPVAQLVRQLEGGVQSGLSYSGAMNLPELTSKARFVRITSAGRAENKPHSIERAPQHHPDFKREYLAAAVGD